MNAERQGDGRASFGERVRSARKTRALSQEQLAKLIGVSAQAVSFWEADRNKPEAGTLAALAEALGVTATFLLSGKPNQSGQPSKPPEDRANRLDAVARELRDIQARLVVLIAEVEVLKREM